LLLVLGLGLVACSAKHNDVSSPLIGTSDVCTPPTSEACPGSAPSYKTDIQPILDQRCNASCHFFLPDGGGQWPFDSAQNTKAWADDIVLDLKACSMPPAGSGVDFPAIERDKVWAWLACGAPDN
jgi:hypothetical protein